MFDTYLDHVCATAMPIYEATTGLISVLLFRRPAVGYVELLTLTMWQSEQALTRFLESSPATNGLRGDKGVIHMDPHVYELVASRQGIRECEDAEPE